MPTRNVQAAPVRQQTITVPKASHRAQHENNGANSQVTNQQIEELTNQVKITQINLISFALI